MAKTESERQKILDRLDEYYLNLSIPDSVRQHVQAEVDTLIKGYERAKSWENIGVALDINVYQLEFHLKECLRNSLIARFLGDEQIFDTFIQHAKSMASKVDAGTDNNYWVPWVARVESFDTSKAMACLSAERAERLCNRYHLSAEKYSDAERYAALSLQLLQYVEDARLRLDIMQRIQTILYQFRGMYDLSFALAKREIPKSKALKFHLRTNGLTFNYANALRWAGKSQLALETFLQTIENTEKYADVPYMSWYKINGLLGKANVYWQLGQYEEALSIVNRLEKEPLSLRERIELYLVSGIIHQYLGNFDKAEVEYKKALALTDEDANIPQRIGNRIIALNNLGSLYYLLTDYEIAISYYDSALAVLEKYNPEDADMQCRILIHFAEVMVAQNDFEKFAQSIRQASELIQFINLPTLKAEHLRTLGRLNMTGHQYQQAFEKFQQAVAIYEDYGLLRASLETKSKLVECLISLSKYRQAKHILNDMYALATEINDAQRKIDAVGMMAEIAWIEGDLDKAIQQSNQLIKEIEALHSRFIDIDNLTMFCQKIHDYLKRAVIYELKKGRVDSAFIKLDYMKAGASKHRIEMRRKYPSNNNSFSYFLDIKALMDRLNEKQLVINYCMTQDTLYAFVLYRDHLKLFKKPIKIVQIEYLANAYMNSINQTIDVFQNYQPAEFVAHYDSIASISQKLYQSLLDWTELQTRLQNIEIIYIIPDEILYGIPFACLMCPGDLEPQFLIQRAAVVNLPSAVFLQSYQNRNLSHNVHKKRLLFSIDRRFPGADDLINFIKEKFPLAEELVLNTPIITKKDILSKLNNQGYEIYIFLGHSEANCKIPDLSFFQLTAVSRVDSSTTSVNLSLAELKQVDWSHAETVFLIGCETAQGKVYRGTGLAGIQQCLLTLGAHEVLASLWKIDSNQSIPQMINFLESWIQKKHTAFSLQEMQIKMIRDLKESDYYKKPHPYIWGSFTLSQTVTSL